MGFATTQSAVWIFGRIRRLVIEAHLSTGLPGFTIVGLAATAIKESKERVRSAIINAGFKFPQQRVTINLSLGNLPKSGTETDLAIAAALLLASDQIDVFYNERILFAGELALDGRINPCDQELAFACCAASHRLTLAAATTQSCVCPSFPLTDLKELKRKRQPIVPATDFTSVLEYRYWSQLSGNTFLKWLAMVVLAGRHSLMLWGPPGTGKTLIAKSMAEVHPQLSFEQSIDAGKQRNNLGFGIAPFCMPHHSVSAAAMAGSANLQTTPIAAQAHNGILFLDELHEFSMQTLDQLRQPIENKLIHISRANIDLKLAADFQLIGATNPCKCGYLGSQTRSCQCSQSAIKKHQSRVSGPLLDRFNINFFVEQHLPFDDSLSHVDVHCQHQVTAEIERIRKVQLERQNALNSALNLRQLQHQLSSISTDVDILVERQRSGLMSFRHLISILQVALTIADAKQTSVSKDELVIARTLCERVKFE